MTGYSRADGRAMAGQPQRRWRWAWELKSVNARGLDIRLRLPGGLEGLENRARDAISARLARGSVSGQLTCRPDDGGGAGVRINRPLLDAILALRDELADGAAGVDTSLRLDALLAVRDMVEFDPPDACEDVQQGLAAPVLAGLDQALEQLQEARAAEGARLGALLERHLERLEALCTRAAAAADGQTDLLRERLKTQIALLLDASPPLPEDRLAQELAALAARADVREETDRLRVHLDACRALLDAGGPAGRRLDFLCQELNREANTICSKAAAMSLTAIGLDLKSAIEQFREQVQNVE